jgi:hypothetical protein
MTANEDEKVYLKQPYYTPIPRFCLEVQNLPLTPPQSLDIISIDNMRYLRSWAENSGDNPPKSDGYLERNS